MYDPRAPTLTTVEEKLFVMKEEQTYPVMSPAQFNQASTPISPVQFVLILF